jgi:alanine dehydrogenase
MLIINKKEVERLLSMPKCIELMEGALASLARGEVVLPLRPVIRIPDTNNAFAVMPTYSSSLKAIGAKLISVFPGNHGTALDSHQGAVALFDGTNGSLLALMDAASITAIRTAAVSGVATKLLARKGATTLAMLGSGVQGRSHVDAMVAAMPSLKRVHFWSRNGTHASALAGYVSKQYKGRVDTIMADARAEHVVKDADVICTVTASREPVLKSEWIKDGAHINAVGASVPSARELDTATVARSRVYVDRRESAVNEAGDLIIPMKEGAFKPESIAGEIGELLIGKVKGRRDDKEVTLFKSLGIAVEDLACAHWLYDQARAGGVGTTVEF